MENVSHGAQNSQFLEQGLGLSRCSISICGRKGGLSLPLLSIWILFSHAPHLLWTPLMLFPGARTHFQPLLCLDECNLVCSIQPRNCSLRSPCVDSVPWCRMLDGPCGIEVFCLCTTVLSNWTGSFSWVGLCLPYLHGWSFHARCTQDLAQSPAPQSNINLFWCVLSVDIVLICSKPLFSPLCVSPTNYSLVATTECLVLGSLNSESVWT